MLLTFSSKSQILQHFDFQVKWRFRARRNLENALYWDISFEGKKRKIICKTTYNEAYDTEHVGENNID